MNSTTQLTLTAVSDDLGVTLTGTVPGPVPTITIDAGNHTTVTVDVTNLSSPVQITAHVLQDAAPVLCELLGADLVELLENDVAAGGTERVLSFSASPAWAALTDLATEQWLETWSPFPLDTSLLAADRVAAGRAARFVGSSASPAAISRALTPLAALARLQADGRISDAAAARVQAALTAARQVLPAGPDRAPELSAGAGGFAAQAAVDVLTGNILPLGALTADIIGKNPDGGITRITGSADWRLSGHGLISLAEDVITATVLDQEDSAETGDFTGTVKIVAPAQDTSGAGEPVFFQAFITDAITGEIIAYTHLHLSGDGKRFEGTAPLARPLAETDIIDLRHPAQNEPVERNLQRRAVDRIHRCAARAYSLQRLTAALPPEQRKPAAVARLWGSTAKEITLARADDLQRAVPARWAEHASAYELLAYSGSAQPSHKHRVSQILAEHAGGSLPPVAEYPVAAPVLAEHGLAGTLALEGQAHA